MLAVQTPGAPQATRSVARPAIPPSPLRDRVGYSDHVRFRGYFPVHSIPAYNLPVYASQWPLPDTTQELGTRLLARLYRGRHLRRRRSTHLQGATLSERCGSLDSHRSHQANAPTVPFFRCTNRWGWFSATFSRKRLARILCLLSRRYFRIAQATNVLLKCLKTGYIAEG